MTSDTAKQNDPDFIDAADLKDLIDKQSETTMIIDVRDEEYFQKHIRDARHIPSGKFKDDKDVDDTIASIPQGTNLVVVHCQLSQVRGPQCANRLAERLQSSKWEDTRAKPPVKVLEFGFEGFYNQFAADAPRLIKEDNHI